MLADAHDSGFALRTCLSAAPMRTSGSRSAIERGQSNETATERQQ
jgi:hypothetical protein